MAYNSTIGMVFTPEQKAAPGPVFHAWTIVAMHYHVNWGFLRRGQLVDNVGIMAAHGHKVAIVHGRHDYNCRPINAWRIAKALRAAGAKVELEFVAGSGHSDNEPGIVTGERAF